MPLPISVLIVEDNPNDAELLGHELFRAGFEPHWQRVDKEADYLECLQKDFDLVLSDYRMPQFNGLRALDLLKRSGVDIPFILVSGTIGEDAAVKAIKEGAADYLLKDNLGRLGTAVTHALSEIRLRRERRQAEMDLRASEEKFRQLAENICEVFWITDPTKTRVLYVSPAYEKIWGRTCESLYAEPEGWAEAIHPEDRTRIWEAALTKQALGNYDEEYRIVLPGGEERWIRDRAFPVRGTDDVLQRLVGIAEDITERKNLREQVLRTQRMEAIVTLAGGIAHDLNNILAPVLLVPQVLRETIKGKDERELLDLVEQSAERGANVIRQLLTFSHDTRGERVSVPLPGLIVTATTGGGGVNAQPSLPRGQGELVLVVDDEESIRLMTRLILEKHGYRVLTANDGNEALAIFLEGRGALRLVLTDMTMPKMNGMALIRALRAVDREIKVVAMSGLTDDVDPMEIEALKVGDVVAKPFRPFELLTAIRAQLAPNGKGK